MAIGSISDAISVTVLAMMMVGSMSKGDGGGGGRCSMVVAPIQTRADAKDSFEVVAESGIWTKVGEYRSHP